MKSKLTVSRYAITAPFDMKIALIADIHGRDASDCVNAISAEKPDIVVVAGDLYNTAMDAEHEYEEEGGKLFHHVVWLIDGIFALFSKKTVVSRDNGLNFLREVSKIAPTYYAQGNHDFLFSDIDREDIRSTGARLLDADCASIPVNKGKFIIGGLRSVQDMDFVDKLSHMEGYKALICHHPERYDKYLRDKDIDLVFSGHAHGGQWRVLGRGLYAPGQGFLPKYTKGVYENRLVVTSGIACTTNMPRINNLPEIAVISLKPNE